MVDAVTFWRAAELASAVILLAALVLMVRFYQQYLRPGGEERQDWIIITVGFGIYIVVKTHFTLLSNAVGVPLPAYPWYVIVFLGLAILSAAALVFAGFYGVLQEESAAVEDADADET